MPTNFIRSERARGQPPSRTSMQAPALLDRRIVITLGEVVLEAELGATPTADRLLMALPIFSKVEPWGEAWHFETHVRTGRDRGARLNAELGEIYYWSDDDRIIIPYGPTPISRPGEIRLPRPCNVIGRVLGDISRLRRVRPTEKVTVEARNSGGGADTRKR